MKELNWKINPKYNDIIVYNGSAFAALEGDTYKVLDYEEKTLHEFREKNIDEIERHPNEGGHYQNYFLVRFKENKCKIFSLDRLEYINENPYYLLQMDSYPDEGGLIRVYDENLEGLMNYNGDIILQPVYKSISINEKYYIGQAKDEIEIFDKKLNIINSLPYRGKSAQLINALDIIRVQKPVEGEPNVYRQERNWDNGVCRIQYEKTGDIRYASGIVDINNNTIIPFEYSTIYNLSDKYLRVTKDEKITDTGFHIAQLDPKLGIIDYDNNIVLPLEYKYLSIQGEYAHVQDFEQRRAIYNLKTKQFKTEFKKASYDIIAQKIDGLDSTKKHLKFKEGELLGLSDRESNVLIPAKYSDIKATMTPDIYEVTAAEGDAYGVKGYYSIRHNKEIVPPMYSDRGGIGTGKRNNQDNVITVMDPETGMAGFYRTDGKKLSETIYDESIEGFSEDLAPVYVNYGKKTGMIDIEGDVVFDFIFDSMTLPYDGQSIVKLNGKVGILNTK